ncbi:APG6-domain-containing protein [Crepidotus variabilis]|uniref:APG6-domain-containing protein n=1 Tax=Crepidotus variabilis TaxID=179855 RepID=A0A9P6EHU7_9AGAR|nr:APG6-domain-containing protein [Crepidotus variabilis]
MSFGPVCQQCKEPLQIDASLVDLAPSAYDMIVGSLPSSSAPSQAPKSSDRPSELFSASKAAWQRSKPSATSGKQAAPLSPRAQGKQPQHTPLLPNESFVLLQDSVLRNIPDPIPSTPPRLKKHSKSTSSAREPPDQAAKISEPDQPNPSPLSPHLRSTARLFNLLSSRTEIDHPLCAECTQILLSNLQRQLDETKKERDGYIAFEKEVRKEREREAQGFSKDDTEKKIEKLKLEEEMIMQQLKEAEQEQEQLDVELRQLEADEVALGQEEAEFWRAYNDHLLAAEQQSGQLATLRAAYAAGLVTLEKLERTNVYNDAFCIGHDGVFGTINGLRLGRVPGVPVEWAEINAAWGQTLLLLYTIARKLDYTFEHYRLVPMGSFSRIEKATGDKANYELYGSGDLHFGRLLHNRRFDISMVAFLDCLKHLMDYVKSQDPSVDFPHQISKDRIGDVSVKLQFNQEEAWTRALRHVLLALKICLKWATNGANG